MCPSFLLRPLPHSPKLFPPRITRRTWKHPNCTQTSHCFAALSKTPCPVSLGCPVREGQDGEGPFLPKCQDLLTVAGKWEGTDFLNARSVVTLIQMRAEST